MKKKISTTKRTVAIDGSGVNVSVAGLQGRQGGIETLISWT
jgi:hypothetical protein